MELALDESAHFACGIRYCLHCHPGEQLQYHIMLRKAHTVLDHVLDYSCCVQYVVTVPDCPTINRGLCHCHQNVPDWMLCPTSCKFALWRSVCLLMSMNGEG